MLLIQSETFKKVAKQKWTLRRILFIILYGLMTYVFVRLLNDVISETKFWLRPFQTNLAEIAGCVLISFIFEFVTNSFLQQLADDNKNQPGPSASLKQFLSLAVYLELVVVSFVFPLAQWTDDGLQWYDVIILSFTIVSFWLFYFSVKQGQQYIHTTHEQALQLERINKDKLENELQLLKAQFHPHFLFNALNTLYFQIDEQNANARFTLEKLADLLRYQLYDQDAKVPLERELTHLKNFIDLQQQRANSQLDLVINWPSSTHEAQLYPLLLLPLVENAFKYVGGSYKIKIDITLENGQLKYQVTNSIPAIAQQHNKGGIGLTNLQKRLNLLYPGKHRFQHHKTDSLFHAELSIEL